MLGQFILQSRLQAPAFNSNFLTTVMTYSGATLECCDVSRQCLLMRRWPWNCFSQKRGLFEKPKCVLLLNIICLSSLTCNTSLFIMNSIHMPTTHTVLAWHSDVCQLHIYTPCLLCAVSKPMFVTENGEAVKRRGWGAGWGAGCKQTPSAGALWDNRRSFVWKMFIHEHS